MRHQPCACHHLYLRACDTGIPWHPEICTSSNLSSSNYSNVPESLKAIYLAEPRGLFCASAYRESSARQANGAQSFLTNHALVLPRMAFVKRRLHPPPWLVLEPREQFMPSGVYGSSVCNNATLRRRCRHSGSCPMLSLFTVTTSTGIFPARNDRRIVPTSIRRPIT